MNISSQIIESKVFFQVGTVLLIYMEKNIYGKDMQEGRQGNTQYCHAY